MKNIVAIFLYEIEQLIFEAYCTLYSEDFDALINRVQDTVNKYIDEQAGDIRK